MQIASAEFGPAATLPPLPARTEEQSQASNKAWTDVLLQTQPEASLVPPGIQIMAAPQLHPMPTPMVVEIETSNLISAAFRFEDIPILAEGAVTLPSDQTSAQEFAKQEVDVGGQPLMFQVALVPLPTATTSIDHLTLETALETQKATAADGDQTGMFLDLNLTGPTAQRSRLTKSELDDPAESGLPTKPHQSQQDGQALNSGMLSGRDQAGNAPTSILLDPLTAPSVESAPIKPELHLSDPIATQSARVSVLPPLSKSSTDPSGIKSAAPDATIESETAPAPAPASDTLSSSQIPTLFKSAGTPQAFPSAYAGPLSTDFMPNTNAFPPSIAKPLAIRAQSSARPEQIGLSPAQGSIHVRSAEAAAGLGEMIALGWGLRQDQTPVVEAGDFPEIVPTKPVYEQATDASAIGYRSPQSNTGDSAVAITDAPATFAAAVDNTAGLSSLPPAEFVLLQEMSALDSQRDIRPTDSPRFMAENSTVIQQAKNALLANAVTDGAGQIDLTLTPEDLGSVRFEMKQEAGGMAVVLFAERPETLDLIRRNVADLISELNDAGVQTSGFAFGTWSERQGQPEKPKAGLTDLSPDEQPTRQSPPPRQATLAAGGLDLRF